MSAIFTAITQTMSMQGAIKQIEAAARRNMHQALGHAGGYIMKAARNLIRKRRGTSAPGSPPHGHSNLLRNRIFYDVDMNAEDVIVGPEALTDRAPVAPSVLEYGGTLTGGGLASQYHPEYTAGHFLEDGFGPLDVGEGGKPTWTASGRIPVRRGRIATGRQAERAALLYHRLKIGARPPGTSVTIAARPYMNPALEAALPRIVEFIAEAA